MRPVLLAAVLALAACGGGGSNTAVLADGTHFGFVTNLEPEQRRVDFDEAELLSGAEATIAAEKDGAVPTQGGHYVRNPDGRAVRLTLADDVVVRLLRPCCELHRTAFTDWLAGFRPDDRSFYGTSRSHYELTISDGAVVAVDERLVE